MKEKEIVKMLKELREHFKKKRPNSTEEEIEHMMLDLFFRMYCEDKMDRDDLTTLTKMLGYEVKDDVLNEIEKEKKERKN